MVLQICPEPHWPSCRQPVMQVLDVPLQIWTGPALAVLPAAVTQAPFVQISPEGHRLSPAHPETQRFVLVSHTVPSGPSE